MYADDVVIFTQAKNVQEAADTVSAASSSVHCWFANYCLLLSTKNMVYMYFSQCHLEVTRSSIFLNGVELDVITEFKYLGVILDQGFPNCGACMNTL